MRSNGFMIFTLLFALIAFVYYKGVVADTVAVGNASAQLLNAVTGRNSQGVFAAYPQGG